MAKRVSKGYYKKKEEVVRVRRGIDKVLITVIPDKFVDVKYKREIALTHNDRYKRLRFGKRDWGGSLHYPLGSWDDTPLINYFVPLKGNLRVMAIINLMRYYNFSNGLDSPRKVSLWDNNIVDPSEHFDMTWFYEALKYLRDKILKDAQELVRYTFDGEYELINPKITVQQIEVCEEAIGLDIIDIKQVYRYTKSNKIEKWSNSTGTVYLNGGYKEQVKFYQKGIGVLRCEFCLNDNSICMDLTEGTDIRFSIEHAIYNLCERIGMPRKWWEIVRFPEKEELWQLLSSTLGVPINLLKRIVSLGVWESNTFQETTTRKLLRRKLIVKEKRGRYVPSKKLLMFAQMLDTLSEPT